MLTMTHAGPPYADCETLYSRFGHYDSEVIDFMCESLQLNPDERGTCAELIEHPMFEIGGFNSNFQAENEKKAGRGFLPAL